MNKLLLFTSVALMSFAASAVPVSDAEKNSSFGEMAISNVRLVGSSF